MTSLERLVVDMAAVFAGIAFAALAMSTLATLAGGLTSRGRTPAPRGWVVGPRWWRRAVLVACGLGLAAPVTAGTALAAEHAHAACVSRCAHSALTPSALSGLQLPDLPALPTDRRSRVVVHPGDSLWLISRNLVAPTASDTAVCRVAAGLYRANRHRIGPDPDLIYPGTVLITPGDLR